jgi:hypothetical protein
MKVTLNHPESKHGYPVILDDDGSLMNTAEGIEKGISKIGITPPQFAAYCNILPTTLSQYGRRTTTPANVLNMLGILLKDPKSAMSHVSKGALELSDIEREVTTLKREGLSYVEIAKKLKIPTRQRVWQIAQAAAGKKSGANRRRAA